MLVGVCGCEGVHLGVGADVRKSLKYLKSVAQGCWVCEIKSVDQSHKQHVCIGSVVTSIQTASPHLQE